MLKRKIRFIINQKSRLIRIKSLQKNINKYISKHDIEYDFSICYDIKEISKSCQECIKLNYDSIIAIGGDGTINICAKYIINTNMKLGIIPKGSGNGTAYTLGLDGNIKKCLNIIKQNKVTKIDIGIVNDKIFLNNTGFGFDAHVSKKIQKKTKRGFKMYLYNIIEDFFSFKEKEYIISTKKEKIKVKAYIVSVFNANQYGNKIIISNNSKMTDGELELVIIKKPKIIYTPLLLFYLITKNLKKSKIVTIINSDKFKIKTTTKLFHIDGDYKESEKNYEIKIHKKALKIIIP